ncbi:GNAT family N-acetyltransferase [Niastella sp. OAS944]|uniref:GNAT family N-acetyltransferase n=1 Tax=Niastella sp. OAS944 TaxID=2664089 RepID=UPI00348312A2|nr:phosphinothricin acetyltransferase [Chitinophagaceae bacterium OAS944]
MINVRIALETDLETILEIYNDAIMNTTAVYDYEPHTLEMRKQWFRIKEAQGYPVFVAEDNGRVVGFSSIGPWRAWAAYKYSVENSIYVAADQRGKGIGKKLLEPLIEAAKQLDLHAIIAGIDATNEVSINLHRHFGFTETGTFKQVGFKFGRWLDLTFMQLLLKTPEQPVDG